MRVRSKLELKTPSIKRLQDEKDLSMELQREEHFWVVGKIWTTNAERRLHWSKRASLVRALRESAFYAGRAKAVSFERPVDVVVRPTQTSRVVADADAYHPAVKAVLDGLVDAKVIENDSPEFVKSVKYLHPEIGKIPGITIWLSYIEGDDFEA
jgi:crossover junction endodeoxyribonuclease RusA